MRNLSAGWSSLAARRAHNPKVVGSNPAPATIIYRHILTDMVRPRSCGVLLMGGNIVIARANGPVLCVFCFFYGVCGGYYARWKRKIASIA